MPLDIGGFVHFPDGPFTSTFLGAFKPVDPCSTTAEAVRRQRTRSHPERGWPDGDSPTVRRARSAPLEEHRGGPHQERRPWELPYHHAQLTPHARRAASPPHPRGTSAPRPSPEVRPCHRPWRSAVCPVGGRACGWTAARGGADQPPRPGRGRTALCGRVDGRRARCRATRRLAPSPAPPPWPWSPHVGDRRPGQGQGHPPRFAASRWRTEERGSPPHGRLVLPRPDQWGQHHGSPRDQRTRCAPSQDRQRRADIKCGIKRGGSGADGPARPRPGPRRLPPRPRRPTTGARWPRGWWRW